MRRPLDFDGLLKLTTVHPKNKLHQTNPTNQFFKFFFISSPFFLKSETYSSNKIKNQTKKKIFRHTTLLLKLKTPFYDVAGIGRTLQELIV
jgi:hypothetical protein